MITTLPDMLEKAFTEFVTSKHKVSAPYECFKAGWEAAMSKVIHEEGTERKWPLPSQQQEQTQEQPQEPAPAFDPEPLLPPATPAPPILQYFAYRHLPPHLQEVSRQCALLAEHMNSLLPNGAEKSAGLRKLLEAKDCFVRAMLDNQAVVKSSPPPTPVAPASGDVIPP